MTGTAIKKYFGLRKQAQLFQGKLLACCLFFAPFLVHAQSNDMRFENITTDNGLAQNIGYSICQTAEGFMWFATQNGLDRYDGYNIKHYRRNDAVPFSLPENQIVRLVTDGKGRLWVSTRNSGIRIYDPKADKFYRLSAIFGTDSATDRIYGKAIKKDKRGIMWVMTSGKGMFAFDTEKRSMKRYLSSDEQHDVNLVGMALTEQGEICVSDGNEFYTFNGSSFEPFGLHQKIGNINIKLHELVFFNGELWASGSGSGIFRMTAAGKLLEHITDAPASRPKGFTEAEAFFKDSKEHLWIATSNNGIFEYDPHTKIVRRGFHDADDRSTLNTNSIMSFYEDRQGIIWAGTNGGGIAKYDASKNFFRHISFKGIAPDNEAVGLHISNKIFFTGTWSGGLITAANDFSSFHNYTEQKNNPASIAGNEVRCFADDGAGNIWVATDEGLCAATMHNGSLSFTRYPGPLGPRTLKYFSSLIKMRYRNELLVSGTTGLFLFDLDTKQWKPFIGPKNYTNYKTIIAYSMLEDSSAYTEKLFGKGNVWLGTDQFGLLLYNYFEGSITEFPGIERISKTVRHVMLQDSNVWLATDNGIISKGIRSNIVHHYFDKEGLPGGVAYALLPDKNGGIWASTNFGISRLNIAAGGFTNYPAGPGTKGTEFNTASAIADSSGQLYFGSATGLFSFDPAAAPRDTIATDVLLTGIDVMNHPYEADSNISFISAFHFPYSQNFITFHFAAPDYFQSQKTIYRCMLEGVDHDWIDLGTSTSKDYTTLPPGDYIFKVQAASGEGVWSPGITYVRLSISPPWWLTWWFRAFIILGATWLLYLFYRARLKKVKHDAAVVQQLSEYELKALHSQMNPHFVFNCLGSIKQMVQDSDKDGAGKYLGKFAKLIRLSLEHSTQSFISLANNNAYLDVYIEMEQLRFKNGFEYVLKVPPDLDAAAVMLPPLMIQPLVENAIWHGLKNSPKPGKLAIEFSVNENMLICEVIDNGPGLQAAQDKTEKHESMGTDNIRRRLELLNEKYGYRSRLIIMNGAKEGVVSRLELPLIE